MGVSKGGLFLTPPKGHKSLVFGDREAERRRFDSGLKFIYRKLS